MDYRELQNYLKLEDQKDSAIIAENDGVIEFGKEVRGKQKISIVSASGETSNYLIPKGKHVKF